jgi:SAM-dependent methyltransferase
MGGKSHWEGVYGARRSQQMSWYQPLPELSLRLIQGCGLARAAPLLDAGGGASTLVDALLAAGHTHLTVLDISATALAAAQARLGTRATQVRWLQADITTAALPEAGFSLWHDRAVFHFLTTAVQRQAYVDAVLRALRPGGHLIVASFAEDGPERCSGLPVQRYSAHGLAAAFGSGFALRSHHGETHCTPGGATQAFVYCHLQRRAG